MKTEAKNGPAQLMAMSQAFWQSQILFTANELGMFETLAAGPRTPAEAARRLKISARGADVLLHALAAMDLVSKKGGRFRLSPVAEKHLVAGRPGYMGNILRHLANLQPAWAQLSDVVRSGRPAPRPHKPDTEEGRKITRNFILGMADLAEPMARELVEKLDLRGVRQALDVGGGPGTYAFALARKKPDIEAAVFDLPSVIPITVEQIKQHGLERRIGTIQGDFLKDSLGEGFDLVIMSNILHSNSPAECRLLIRKGYRALNPGGRLVVNEFALRPDRTGPPMGALFSVNMLVNTPGGMAYSSEDITAWMRAAGFRGFKSMELMGRSTAIVGMKPKAPGKSSS